MAGATHKKGIVILDFGGQYAHLIASRVRRFDYFSEIHEAGTPAADLKDAAGIILSGGPQSVYEKGSPQADPKIFELGIPILGLCYGHQWVAHALGGKVEPAQVKEYGATDLVVQDRSNILFNNLPDRMRVWMSHGDEVTTLPGGFSLVASTRDCINAVMVDLQRKIFSIQFHIEVTHTPFGMDLLKRFVEFCTPQPWSIKSYANHIGEEVKKDVGSKKVFMLVSGGVDSTVAFTLLNKVLGADRVQGLLIDTGLMRKNEVTMIQDAFAKLGIKNLHVEDASQEFFVNLKGVVEPEAKRKVIGDTFLAVQKRVSEKMNLKIEDGWMLGQGTIYPDTIETGGTKHADTIKTHHNRVEAIQKMMEQGLVIEPLKELYKDEVRTLGEELGLPHDLVWRHPFPGPGLGVRILCSSDQRAARPAKPFVRAISGQKVPGLGIPHSILPIQSVGVQGDGRTYRHALVLFSDDPCTVTAEHSELATSIPNANKDFNRVLLCTSQATRTDFAATAMDITKDRADLLREADAIVDEEMRVAGLYQSIWQFPVVLLPVGLSSGGPARSERQDRSGGQSIVLRPVHSHDAMTADSAPLPKDVLQKMTQRIMRLPGIHTVLLDLTNKPPATIEWE